MTPFLSNRVAYDKILGYVQKAKDAGDEILIGGSGKQLLEAFAAPHLTNFRRR